MTLRVVIDSNVYVSAIVFGGVPRAVLTLGQLGRFQLCVSPQIRAEVEETLGRKFRWNQEKVNNACMPLWHHAEEVQPTLVLDVTADPDDNRILECAVAGVAQAIVTGDDDLLRLKKFEGVEIIKPRVFLNRFE